MFADTVLQIDLPRDTRRSLQRSRVDLRSGTRVAVALRPNPGDAMEQALLLACKLARAYGLPVSLPAPGRLEELPRLAAIALEQAGLTLPQFEFVIEAGTVAFASPEALQALRTLRNRGYGLALAGMMAVHGRLLDHLPVTAVIVSHVAVDALSVARSAAVDIRDVAASVAARGLNVVAPDVDTEARRAALAGLGCHQGEGALFSG